LIYGGRKKQKEDEMLGDAFLLLLLFLIFVPENYFHTLIYN